MMTMNIGVTCRLLLVTLVLFAGVEKRSSSQTMPAQEQKDAEEKSPQQLTERVANSSLPLSQRVVDYGKLSVLEPKDRDAAFSTLVNASDESIAAMSAAALIRDRYPKATELVVPRISLWSSSNQMVVLQAIRFNGDEQSFLEIPRALMKQSAGAGAAEPKASPGPDPLEEAALILTASRDASDRTLLRNALLSRPQSRGLWLAVSTLGELPADEASLAAAAYNNPKLPIEVRVAAAAALAPRDSGAASFAVQEIESFLIRFSARETGEILLQTDQNGKRELYYLREHLALAGTLRFLNTADAEKLTFSFLEAKNEEIRMTMGLLAAVRWPQRLLAAGQGAFTREEYESLMGYVSLLHPDLRSQILGKIPQQRLDEVTARLLKSGAVGVFGLPAVIVLG
jgi:hypothetical protein